MNTYSNETPHMNTSVMFGNSVLVPNNRRGILLVEDGSIDVNTLEEELMGMGIKVLIYRSGSQKPDFIRLDK